MIKKNGEEKAVFLSYRVVESKIAYDTKEIPVTVKDTDSGLVYEYVDALFLPGKPENSNQAVNRLQVADFSVTKQWENDHQNIYGSRPATQNPAADWETSFVIQRSVDGKNWEDVAVYEGESEIPLIVTLYGTNADDAKSLEIRNLPAADLKGNSYRYRAMELQPGDVPETDEKPQENDVVEEGGRYYGTYDAFYTYTDEGTMVRNKMDAARVFAEKRWRGPENAPVTLTLQYQVKEGEKEAWRNINSIVLDGAADTDSQVFGEYEPWKAVWNGLPAVWRGSTPDDTGKTVYRVIEKVPEGFLQVGETEERTMQADMATYPEFVFTNVKTVSLEVEKYWHGIEGEPVIVGLYRKTADQKAKLLETVELSKENGWKHIFRELPKYQAAGECYSYFAREMKEEDLSYKTEDESDGWYVVHKDSSGENTFRTVIRNIKKTEIFGRKTWRDHQNAYDTRPDTIVLTLYRQAEGTGFWEKVTDQAGTPLTPQWSKDLDEVGIWQYTFGDFPAYDREGRLYTYRVEETPYALENGDFYQGAYDKNNPLNLTNTLTGITEVRGTKFWMDGSEQKRPEKITINLYGNNKPVRETEVDAGCDWRFAFTNLPKYDEDGKQIIYDVREAEIPEGYDVFYEGSDIYNVRHGGLIVSKSVGGNAGETDRRFHFVVTLSDNTVNGTYGEMEFVNGVAEFTLKDGESIVASDGLPAGISYQVIESEANLEGYVTTGSGWNGEIRPDMVAQVMFINTKNIRCDEPPKAIPESPKTGEPFSSSAVWMFLPAGILGGTLSGRRQKKKKR